MVQVSASLRTQCKSLKSHHHVIDISPPTILRSSLSIAGRIHLLLWWCKMPNAPFLHFHYIPNTGFKTRKTYCTELRGPFWMPLGKNFFLRRVSAPLLQWKIMSAWGWKSQEHLATRRETTSVQRQEEQKERKKVGGGRWSDGVGLMILGKSYQINLS